MINQATMDFALRHRCESPVKLALGARPAPGVDLAAALRQVAGWQAARRKLPSWAAMDGIVYPPHIAMEQCSSEHTARYKAEVAARLLGDADANGVMYDLTGGFGADFSFLSRLFGRAVYIERQEELAEVARHNFAVLGIKNAEVRCSTAAETLHSIGHATMIYLDPARRDTHGGRTFALADCTPDVLAMMGELRGKADLLMLKLSPMLDWHEVARQLGGISELHIVSVRNECKEIVAALLSPASAGMSGDEIGENNATAVHCVNDGSEFVFIAADASQRDARQGCAVVAEIAAGDFLYVPNASVMKAGCFGEIASRYGMTQVSANSHLFVSPHFTGNFPGRVFLINAISSMNRRELRKALGGISCANVAVRNFPLTAERLRRRLGLSDGGDDYLFATTDCDGRHIVLLCRKATPPDGGAAGT